MKKNIANICSLMNAVCGLFVILILSCYSNFYYVNIACVFILFGVFFDSIDGNLARKFNCTSELGRQLDSFADLITFGIAPICMYIAMDRSFHTFEVNLIKIIIGIFYILCAVYRLAKFNVSSNDSYFTGLPTTASGLILSCLVLLINNILSYSILVNFHIIDLSILLLAFLMVSPFKVNKIIFK